MKYFPRFSTAIIFWSALLLSNVAQSQMPGSVDESFGDGGTVITQFGIGYDQPTGMVIQPDQKIVVGGHAYLDPHWKSVLVRLDEQGDYDNTFNGTGISTPDFDYIALADPITDLLIQQPDGKLVFGTATDNLHPEMGLVRFNTDGSIDSSFGDNGLASQEVYFDGTDEKAVRLQPDGKILVVGNAPSSNSSLAAARFNADGSPDVTFNGSGSWLYDYKINEFIIDARILPDGKILLFIGYFDAGAKVGLVRLNEDGSIDNTFGTVGILPVIINEENTGPRSLTLLADGKILLAGIVGDSDHDIYLVKMDEDGVMDNSFGTAGIVLTENGGNIYGEDVVEADDGNILVAGYHDKDDSIEGLVLRFLPNGVLDASFGDDGFAHVIAYDYRFENIRLQADKQIVVSGWYRSDASTVDFEWGVTRLNYVDNVGISGVETKLQLAISPNPSDGNFKVELANNLEPNTMLEIHDESGRVLYNEDLKSAKTEMKMDLPVGIYFAILKTDGERKIQKLVIEK